MSQKATYAGEDVTIVDTESHRSKSMVQIAELPGDGWRFTDDPDLTIVDSAESDEVAEAGA